MASWMWRCSGTSAPYTRRIVSATRMSSSRRGSGPATSGTEVRSRLYGHDPSARMWGLCCILCVCISVSVSNLLNVARTWCHSGTRWSSWFCLLTRCYSDLVDCSQVCTCVAQQMSVSGVAASADPMCSWEYCKTLPNFTIGLAWFRCAVLIAFISQCFVLCVLFTTSLGDMC